MDKFDLRDYRRLKAEAADLKARLIAWEGSSGVLAGQKLSRTPGGPADYRDTMDAVVDQHQKLLRLYATAERGLIARALEIETAVERLEDPDERMLIRYRYFDGYAWEKIGRLMGYSLRNIYRIHGHALQHLPRPCGLVDDKAYSGLISE